jgi:predicted Fe-Mo cluster-binding NifX family protein
LKVAIGTDDGVTVSRHFGRAGSYAVLTVENDEIVAREIRPKLSPHGSASGSREEHGSGPHGIGAGADLRHDQMAMAIADCSVVICAGMGQGAYDRMTANGIQPIVTDLMDVNEAAIECAAGRIVDHAERLH